jgi:hypothetical protein
LSIGNSSTASSTTAVLGAKEAQYCFAISTNVPASLAVMEPAARSMTDDQRRILTATCNMSNPFSLAQ